jgi:hypothetical protein
MAGLVPAISILDAASLRGMAGMNPPMTKTCYAGRMDSRLGLG